MAITTTFYVDHAPVIEIVRFVRRHLPGTKIVLGGPHVFNIAGDFDEETQDFIFGALGADIYIIDSQGEDTLARVVSRLRGGPATSTECPTSVSRPTMRRFIVRCACPRITTSTIT